MPDINKNADLVERLRDFGNITYESDLFTDKTICDEAATLIETQAAEITRLRDALFDINNMETGWANSTVKRMATRARTALNTLEAENG
jgi:hypothetical protein